MSTLLIVGSAAGAILGALHAWGVYRQRVAEAVAGGGRVTAPVRLKAGYAAAWTALLWTAFGSYVLVLWLLSLPIWAAARARSRPLGVEGA